MQFLDYSGGFRGRVHEKINVPGAREPKTSLVFGLESEKDSLCLHARSSLKGGSMAP